MWDRLPACPGWKECKRSSHGRAGWYERTASGRRKPILSANLASGTGWKPIPQCRHGARGVIRLVGSVRRDDFVFLMREPSAETIRPRPAGASRGGGEPLAFTIGGEREARLNILTGQPGEIGGNLVHSHPGSERLQHILGGAAHPPDARLAAALVGFHREDVLVAHRRKIRRAGSAKSAEALRQ